MESLPKHVRVSLGSAVAIGLLEGRLNAAPTTAYLMAFTRGKCTANCGFCAQARTSSSRTNMLSRVTWPILQTRDVIAGISRAERSKIKRVCIQALNRRGVFRQVLAIVRTIHGEAKIPISVSCQPLDEGSVRQLMEAGAERIGIPLDAATEALFDRIKGSSEGGPYEWGRQFRLLAEAVKIFGRGRVSTHVIAGLGETEREMATVIQRCWDMGVLPGLFAFTPIAGTAMENTGQPSVQSYRRMQVARHLIVQEIARCEDMRFNEEGHLTDFGIKEEELMSIIRTGRPFLTSGCPSCNRPYYNEKPSGPMYNYPRDLTPEELADAQEHLRQWR